MHATEAHEHGASPGSGVQPLGLNRELLNDGSPAADTLPDQQYAGGAAWQTAANTHTHTPQRLHASIKEAVWKSSLTTGDDGLSTRTMA